MSIRPLIGIATLVIALPAAALASPRLELPGSNALAALINPPDALGTGPSVFVDDSRPTEGGLVRLSARASAADSRVTYVDFRVDGTIVGSDSAAPYSFDWNPGDVAAGQHQLIVNAWTADGGSAQSAPATLTSDGRLDATVEIGPSQSLADAVASLPSAGGTVHLAPGIYPVDDLELGDGVHLIGSGPATVLRADDAVNYNSLLDIVGRDVSVRDLTIDGNGGRQTGGEGWAVQVGPGSRDVVLSRIDLVDAYRQGVYIWGDHQRVSVQDSSIDGAGQASSGVRDAITDSKSGDTSVLRTTIRNTRDFGINFFPWTPDRVYPGARALAVGNVIEHVQNPARDDGTSESGIWTGGVNAVIRDNTISDTGWDGIQTFGASRHTVIAGNRVSHTGVGIYVEHETWDSLIEDNTLTDITGNGINVEWRYDGEGSGRLVIRGNVIMAPGRYGVFIDVGANDNVISQNVVSDARLGAVRLQGSTGNLVTGNDLRGTRQQYCGTETTGHTDNGDLAQSDHNQFGGNDCRGARSGSVRLHGASSVASANIT